MRGLRAWFSAPVADVMASLDRVLEGKVSRLLWVFVGLGIGWWLYVPIHELLHAGGCLVAGGSVQELEVAPEYGGAILAKVFPFVVAGGDYAGRLSGFDDHGSFWIHLAAVLAPYLLTVFPGVWVMLWAASRGSALVFGLALPTAFAPFVSLAGDAYEVGSLVIAELPKWNHEQLVSDDLVLLLSKPHSLAEFAGIGLGVLLALLWAFSTYGLGRAVAQRITPLVGATPR